MRRILKIPFFLMQRWLDPNKPLRKQWDSAKGDANTPFLFRVKVN